MKQFHLLGVAALAIGGLTWLALSPSTAYAQRRAERRSDQQAPAVENQARGEQRKLDDSVQGQQLQSPRGPEQGERAQQRRDDNAQRRQGAPPQQPTKPNAVQQQEGIPGAPTNQPQVRQGQQGRQGQRRGFSQEPGQRGRPQGFANLGLGWEDKQDRLTIRNLAPNSAAAQTGLQAGDQIASIGGQNVTNQQQFDAAMRQQFNRYGNNRNYRIPIVVYRNGNPYTLYWTWQALALAGYGPFAPGWRGGYYDGYYGEYTPYQTGYRGVPNQSSAFLGVDLNQRVRNAAVVERVYPGSPAEQAGLKQGDVIWSINEQPINSPREVSYTIGQMQPGQAVDIRFGRPFQVQAVLAQRGASGAAAQVPVQQPGAPDAAPSGAGVRVGSDVQAPAVPAPSDAAPQDANPQPENSTP